MKSAPAALADVNFQDLLAAADGRIRHHQPGRSDSGEGADSAGRHVRTVLVAAIRIPPSMASKPSISHQQMVRASVRARHCRREAGATMTATRRFRR